MCPWTHNVKSKQTEKFQATYDIFKQGILYTPLRTWLTLKSVRN